MPVMQRERAVDGGRPRAWLGSDAMSPLTFAIGDIHGCLDKLRRLVAACEAHAAGRPARYVFLGDYIDRGPNSRGVVEFLMRRQQARPGTLVCLRGNHEQLAIDAHDDERAMPLWLQNSGATTQRNYWQTNGRISDTHLAWLRALPFCHDDGLRFFVHAGVDLAVPLDAAVGPGDAVDARAVPDRLRPGRLRPLHRARPHPADGPARPTSAGAALNLDTGAVIGGPLTAAAFDDTRPAPMAFLTDRSAAPGWLATMMGRGGARR